MNLFWQLSDGTGGLERLTNSEYLNFPMSWSPDGQVLAFVEVTPTTGYDLWMLDLRDRKAQPFLRTPFNESVPQFSPNGRWLAYISNESGRWEIYVQSYPASGGKWQISTEGGTPQFHGTFNYLFRDSLFNARPTFAAEKPDDQRRMYEAPARSATKEERADDLADFKSSGVAPGTHSP